MRRTYIGATIIGVGLLLLQTQSGIFGRAYPVAAAQESNVIVRKRLSNEPVRITGLRVRGNPVSFGNAFAGDENWFDAVAAEIKNTSGKRMTDAQLSVSFNTEGVQPRRIQIPLAFSGLILPDQTVQVTTPATGGASLRAMLARRGEAANFRKAEFQLQFAKFEDGSVWVKGATLGARDPRTGRRKRM